MFGNIKILYRQTVSYSPTGSLWVSPTVPKPAGALSLFGWGQGPIGLLGYGHGVDQTLQNFSDFYAPAQFDREQANSALYPISSLAFHGHSWSSQVACYIVKHVPHLMTQVTNAPNFWDPTYSHRVRKVW